MSLNTTFYTEYTCVRDYTGRKTLVRRGVREITSSDTRRELLLLWWQLGDTAITVFSRGIPCTKCGDAQSQ